MNTRSSPAVDVSWYDHPLTAALLSHEECSLTSRLIGLFLPGAWTRKWE